MTPERESELLERISRLEEMVESNPSSYTAIKLKAVYAIVDIVKRLRPRDCPQLGKSSTCKCVFCKTQGHVAVLEGLKRGGPRGPT